MKSPLKNLLRDRRRGLALIIVITTIALISVLVVAIFSVTRTEYRATQGYVAGKSARQYADMTTAIVMAQIQNGQNTITGSERTTHATQPGMIRVYNANGTFNAAYKLYSAAQMKVTGSSESVLYGSGQLPPTNWYSLPSRYVDLNEPVIRPPLTGSGAGAGTYAVFFPVIDPRAAWNDNGAQTADFDGSLNTTRIAGFSYSENTPDTGGGASSVSYADRVVLPTEANTSSALRLPMPVEWLYVLQDGTTGTLNESNTFVSSSSVVPSVTNPIVGRMAFWTDDESCKININTASEPTTMGSPYYYHERDRRWAHFPAASREYQRYPGHPATVALSAIFAPNYRLDPLEPNQGLTVSQIVELKNKIYTLMPKIGSGGSDAGTKPFAQDDFSSRNNEDDPADLVDLSAAKSERLFASVDEMLFTDSDYSTANGRQPAQFMMPGGNIPFFDNDKLERSRFFLTAQSRSPEFSIHGLPRICMWPLADESLGDNYRTSFDNIIALCGTMRKPTSGSSDSKTYFFRRKENRHSTIDVKLPRNEQLLTYLTAVMGGATYPATAASSATSSGVKNFSQKYGSDNVNQMAIEFYDYIRCINLYDGILARNNDGMAGNGQTGSARYTTRDSMDGNARTFTDQRISPKASSINNLTAQKGANNVNTSRTGVMPGHGMVTPAIWQKGTTSYRGFGRMFTISEIGFQFICTADGLNDTGAVGWGPGGAIRSGGGTAPYYDPETLGGGSPTMKDIYPYTTGTLIAGNQARWFSNYPPLSGTDTNLYGVNAAVNEFHPSKHPGYDPANWNASLALDTPLGDGEKRVQVLLLLETFCPSLGWTKFFPEYTIVLDGTYVNQIQLNNQRLFPTTGDIAIKSNDNLYEFQDTHSVGGHASPSAMVGGRRTRSINGNGAVSMPSDLNYGGGNTSGHNALADYDLISNFVTVNRNSNMTLTCPGGDLKIKIFDTHNWQSSQPIQIINVNLSGLPTSIPVPHLVGSTNPLPDGSTAGGSAPYTQTIDSFGRIRYTRSRQGPHYWCANYAGCLDRFTGRVNPSFGASDPMFWQTPPAPVPQNASGNSKQQATRGRLDTAAGGVWNPPGTANGFGIIPDAVSDVIRTMVPTVGDYRIIAAMYDVPSTYWRPHPSNGATVRQAHSFTGMWGTAEPGARLGATPSDVTSNPDVQLNLQLVGGARHDLNPINATQNKKVTAQQPDLPGHPDWAAAANAFGDFDAGIANARDGPYINKPDEGNFYVGPDLRGNVTRYYRSGYFYESWESAEDWRSGIYMTPNRLVSSPVMFGSLPSGVWAGGSGSLPKSNGIASVTNNNFAPWRTLLFRPHANVSSVAPASVSDHPGASNPSDHYLLDMFYMPVVEPYAISEPLSVAGRINMNFQIMPFTNIRRATAMHAVMKGEFITAVPNSQVNDSKRFNTISKNTNQWEETFWKDSDARYWHRPIDVRSTLRQFDLKFNHRSGGAAASQGLFRSASQICEMHLIPRGVTGTATLDSTTLPSVTSTTASSNIFQNTMNDFWSTNRATGDNVRERPYSNLYARLTTRSNTFRVHVRAQVVKKARSVAVNMFDATKDTVLSEYRGSTLIERYIDPNDNANLPDYAASSDPLNALPLDVFYRFRVLESKRFSP